MGDDNGARLRGDRLFVILEPGLVGGPDLPHDDPALLHHIGKAEAAADFDELAAGDDCLLAEAEGKRASLMAEADKVQAIEMAPALAIEKMIETGMTPEMIVQYKTVDQLKGIAEAQAEVYEHIHLGEVTVYGNENTAGNFMASMAENLNPAFELLKSIPFKKTLNAIAGKDEVKKD